MAESRRRKEQESRRIIDRVGAETEARMPSLQADGDGADWAEVWGKRIGRVLSFVLFGVAVVLLYNLIVEAG